MEKEYTFHLTTGMLDQYDRLRPYAILDLFQEMAGFHAEEIGVGYDAMIQKGYNWVITKNKFEVKKYPKANENIKVYTWPIIPGKCDFDRGYLIKDQNDEVLVEGKSKWCVIDSITHKIIRSDNVVFNGEYINRNSNIEFERTPLLNVTDLEYKFDYIVRPSMLDHYHHMNNAKYAEVVLDVLDLDETTVIQTLQINNFHEIKCGEIIKLYYTTKNDLVYIYGYTNESTNYTTLAFNALVKLK